MQFLLAPDGQVYEKENGMCHAWDSHRGVFGRDFSLPPIRWVDLVKERAPVVSISLVEAMMILMLRWIGEVKDDAQENLSDHKTEESPHIHHFS
jgi:hypothetical protein